MPKETNEISGFRPLLADLDLTGVVVTADALHTQTDHARFLVQDKQAAYVVTVKGNQPGLEATINHLAPEAFPPPHTETARGHRRIEQRTIQTASPPGHVTFPTQPSCS